MAKPSSRRTDRAGSSYPRKKGGVFSGVLIGLMVGAVLSVGVALWVTGSNPFKLISPSDPTPAHPAASAAVPAQATPPEIAPSFDFYKVLPGSATNVAPTPVAAPQTTLYYLQAGAFQNPADADNLKAQLALLGVEAAIQTSELGDRGIFHRVRIGPFRAMDEINRTRTLLTQNNIPATLVKEVPTSQETP